MKILFESSLIQRVVGVKWILSINNKCSWVPKTVTLNRSVVFSVNNKINPLLASILHICCEVRLKMNEKESL